MCPNKVILKTDSVIAQSYYHIRPGDNLNKISKAYNVPVWQLAEWNNIEDINKIKMGDSLKILLYGYDKYDPIWNKREPYEELNETLKQKRLPAYHTIDSIGVQPWNKAVDYINNSNQK